MGPFFAVKVSVQYFTVALLRNDEKGKSYKIMISISRRHSKCFVAGSQNCDDICMLLGRDAALDEHRHIGVKLFQK